MSDNYALVNRQTGEILEDKIVLTRTALQITEDLSFDEYKNLSAKLDEMESGVQWWKGDQLNYGEKKYGETYEQAEESWNEKQGTLRDYKWVSGRVELSVRTDNLGWHHHRLVAPYDKETQKNLLSWCEETIQETGKPRSVAQLREEIRLRKRQAKREVFVPPSPDSLLHTLICCPAEALVLESETVDIIITSPPYNLGSESWPMGGDGRTERDDGIGYEDSMQEDAYQVWQINVLAELYRVSKQGASLFYNHKVRQRSGTVIHPMDWLRSPNNPWILRQEIIWDRGSTHNHVPTLFWPQDERIYWFTKGAPRLPEHSIGMASVLRFHGPVAGTWHPAPFSVELPSLLLEAVARSDSVVLDPFAGSCSTLKASIQRGLRCIGVDVNQTYLDRAEEELLDAYAGR